MRLYVEDLQFLAPELTLVIAAVILSLLDLLMPKRINRNIIGWLTIGSLMISAAFVVWFMTKLNSDDPDFAMLPVSLLNASYRLDDFANLFKLVFLLGTALIIFMSMGSVKKEDIPHRGEFYYLFLPAVLGASIMASSGDLITLFVGLELLSITSYIMVGMRKANHQSNEAAFKYVITGGIASAFILYGMSFLYGVTGTTNVTEINAALSQYDPSFSALVYLSFFLMLVGFGFKIAAAPFHTWAADVYQGAPTPVTAFLAVISKAAGFAIMFRVIYNVYFSVGDFDTPIYLDIFLSVTVLAAVAMILGNAMALRQKNVKRLLAYSGIANAGYLLVPIGIQFGFFHYSNFSELFFYLIAYMFMNLGAFAVLMAVSQASGHDELRGFAGLYHRAPFTAWAMVIMLLSLAGLPITGGFFGKLFIILGTLQMQIYWLAAIMIATSVLSFYYYFGFIRQMFMRAGHESKEIKLTYPLAITIWICAGASVIMGFIPHVIIGFLENVFSLSMDFFMIQ